MKGLLAICIVAGAGYFFYHKYVGGPPRAIENPVYGEMRMTAQAGNREIEAAVFVRSWPRNAMDASWSTDSPTPKGSRSAKC
jgi:hypothetical protein